MKGKYIWSLLIILAVIIFYFSRTSTFTTDIKFEENDKVIVDQKSDQRMPSQIPEVLQDRIAYQHYSKTDLLFVVLYNFNLQVDPTLAELSGEETPKIKFSTHLPGKVTSGNATSTQDNELIWTKIPENAMTGSSYAIRWWLLAFVGLVIVILGYNFYQKRGRIIK